MKAITLPESVTRESLVLNTQSYGCTESITADFLRVALENVILFDRKQHDYGPRNISDFGLPGVIVRMNDKWNRIIHLTKGGRKTRVRNESLEDSFRDFAVYAQIAQLLIRNKWPQP